MNLPPDYEKDVFVREPMSDAEREWSMSNDDQEVLPEEIDPEAN